MAKITVKGMRLLSTCIIVVLVSVVAVFAFVPERSVLISGKESYQPYYNGSRDRKEVSLMFNVYEGSDIVRGILDVLDEYGAKSTFFVGGCWADDNGDVLEEILTRGHELGNHGYFHLNHKKLSENDNIEEIANNHKVIKGLVGADMNLFAPPSGAFSTKTLTAAEKLGYKTIMWSKDTVDWRDKDKNIVYKRATKDVANGDLILMHPKQHTLEALDGILKFYKENGIRAVTVSECIKENDS